MRTSRPSAAGFRVATRAGGNIAIGSKQKRTHAGERAFSFEKYSIR
jgi:hypothetical protein